jgi:hypothetical protein
MDDRYTMNCKGYGRKWYWHNFKVLSWHLLEGLRRITIKNISLDSQSLGRDLNPGPPEYEGVLKTLP